MIMAVPVLRLPEIPDLYHDLRQLLAQVPSGRVTTCGALAEALGNPIAACWIGHFTLHHAHEPHCPCHRVVRVGGELGPHIAGGSDAKARLLAAEGVEVQDGRVDLQRYGYGPFAGDRPLERLRLVQEELAQRISLRPRRRIPKFVGGVDVGYPRPDEGIAAYALVETDSGQLIWSTMLRRPVRFPYITSYLSFRELPLLLEMLDAVRTAGRLAEVLLVDGSGILHHRHAGIASYLGVAAGVPTIGVTKKLLCGEVDWKDMEAGEVRGVVYQGERIGVAVRPTAGSRRPIFVSPGHRVDVDFAAELVRRLLRGRRLPEPLYWADRLGRSG